jgi:hypothetical protein
VIKSKITAKFEILIDIAKIRESHTLFRQIFGGYETERGVYGHEQRHLSADKTFYDRLRDSLTKEEESFGDACRQDCEARAAALQKKYQDAIDIWYLLQQKHGHTEELGTDWYPTEQIPEEGKEYQPEGDTMPNDPNQSGSPFYDAPPGEGATSLPSTILGPYPLRTARGAYVT